MKQTSDLESLHLDYQSPAMLFERLLRDDQAKQLRELLTSAAMPEARCDSSDLRVLLRKSKDGGAVLGVCNVSVQAVTTGKVEVTGEFTSALDLAVKYSVLCR